MHPYTPKRQCYCLWCLESLEKQDFSFLIRHDYLCLEHEEYLKSKVKKVMINGREINYFFEYDHKIASLYFRYKEHKDIPLCGCLFYPQRKQLNQIFQTRSVVIVPSSLSKTNSRGFHPLKLSLEICGIKTHDILKKVEDSDQKNKDKSQRELTQFGITFPNQPLTHEVVLVDDVLTTGNSLMRCWDLLESQGHRVIGCVLAINSSWLV
jgi:predicted amidophosphoribosyltransferase